MKRKRQKKNHSKLVFVLLFAGYLGVSAYLLFATGDALPQLKKLGFLAQLAAYFKVEPDKVMHTLLFLPIIPLAWAAIKPRRVFTKVLVLWSGLLFGILTEVIQYYLPYRTGDIGDLAADVMGSVLGMAFLVFFQERKKK
ncbi:MAG: VanZ family protein [Bacteroidales bacterium]|jgi:VanZ family protein|nr:VanZ family protein [Bacteroidales bacterium]NLK79765.1 VanZ family protein [Bacteroidales bacterium]HKM30729.1 VanZ family protein [Bacteroidales bacterium]HPX79510.1 VanZ family protein [Bacteroidales bacterium]HQB23522.1 VanZ family protein [Bacteroidales bacterium]